MHRVTLPRTNQQAKADTWNRRHAIGTRVVIKEDDGKIRETNTSSRAWMMGSNAVVNVICARAPYPLKNISAA